MKIKSRKYIEVFYDPGLKNWDEVIEAELKRCGLEHGAVTVICKPLNGSMKKSSNSHTREYHSGLNPTTQSNKIQSADAGNGGMY